jgi:uncharacterized protein
VQVPEPDLRPSMALPDSEDPAWGGWDVVAVLVAFFVGFVISSLALGLALHSRKLNLDQLKDARIILPVQAFLYGVVFVAMYIIVRGVYHRRFWPAIRWNWPHRNWLYFIPAGFVLAIVTEAIQAKLPMPKNMPIEEFFRNPTSAYLMGLIAIAGAPIIEELFFRGLLYPVLARRIGVWLGVVTTALSFGLIHASQVGWAWSSILLLFVVGLVLTIVRARTRSVAASFLVHTAYNTTIFVLLWLSTDHFRHLEKIGATILLR